MCGIFAVLRKAYSDERIFEILKDGMLLLQNRGYDSIGISALVDFNTRKEETHHFVWKKASSKDVYAMDSFQKLCFSDADSYDNVIAHTRWATHGPKTDENAHPHHDQSRKIWVIHNGILENYKDLYAKCIVDGDQFESQTDTEVIAHWLGKHWDIQSPLKGLAEAEKHMEGTWALIIQHVDFPENIWIMKRGSPLCIAYTENAWILASEGNALGKYVHDFCALNEHQILQISSHSPMVDVYQQVTPEHCVSLPDCNPMEMRVYRYFWEQFKILHGQVRIVQDINPILLPSPYPYWMIREIMEQPEAFRRALNHGARWEPNRPGVHLGGLSPVEKSFDHITSLLFVACGTSLYAGQWGAVWFRRLLELHSISTLDASEWDSTQWARDNTAYCFLSQSGETKDVHRAIMQLKNEAPYKSLFSIVNVVDSLIARETGVGLYCNAGPERAVASTKSFLNQCAILSLVLVWFYENRKPTDEPWPEWAITWRKDVNAFPDVLESWLKDQYNLTHVQGVIEHLLEKERVFILGRGSTVAIAREGALKLKEVAYIHAEGFVGGALKHGPFSLIEEGTPVIILAVDTGEKEDILRKQIIAAEETKSRGAFVIFITDSNHPDIEHCSNYIIRIPTCGYMTSLLTIVPLQLLAYYIAIVKDVNPDYPRNLAKVVTVDG